MLSQKLQEQMRDLENQLDEATKLDLVAGAKELFDKYPNLESLGWPQYSPYFNDGDPCTFSVHTDPNYDIRVNDHTISELDEEEDEESRKELEEEIKLNIFELESITTLFCHLLDKLDQDALERLFGEGLVKINYELVIETEEYDHD